MNSKKKAILDRIKHLEEAIAKGREYLESGSHAHWHGFRPLFASKVRDGKVFATAQGLGEKRVPSHAEKALRYALKTLDKMG